MTDYRRPARQDSLELGALEIAALGDGALGGAARERDERVAWRHALAELQLEEARQDAVAGGAAEGPQAAAAIGIFFKGQRAVLEECVRLALQLELRRVYDDRELVVLATTIAQVNYWARLNHGLGVPAAGFFADDGCAVR